MSGMDPYEKFHEYLRKIRDPENDKCWFCHKTPDKIRQEYFEYMKHPDKAFEHIEIDDLAVISYKLKKPICASCYFSIKQNIELINEIMERSDKEVW